MEKIDDDEIIRTLRMLADGLQIQEIANAMFLSVRAVNYRLAEACRRLEARSRLHAVARAYDKGWLIPRPKRGRHPVKLQQSTSVWENFPRPEMLSDRMGYPWDIGDQEWEKIKHLWHVVDGKWTRRTDV